MAKVPSIKEQIEAVDKELRAEEIRWHSAGIGDPGAVWHPGHAQFAFRCETLTIIDILKEKLEISQEELDLRFKRIILREMRELFPQYEELAKEARRRAIVDGVQIIPPNGRNEN